MQQTATSYTNGPRMFKCSQCGKSYQRKAHLLRHEATHSNQLSSSCPFCKKSFLKSEVARRHSKTCASKHGQPSPPAAKPGRKRQSCDECFWAKTACDGNYPCSRCISNKRKCTVADAQALSTKAFGPTRSLLTPRATRGFYGGEGPFSFLRHFTDPYVKQDRLAIGETAEHSMRRNLETLYSHIEDALVPTDLLPVLDGDPSMTDLLPQFPSAVDDSLAVGYTPHGAFSSKLSGQLNHIMVELIETSKSMDQQRPLDMAALAPLFTIPNVFLFVSAFFHSLHWHLPVVHFPTFDPGNISNPLLIAIFLTGATYASSLNEATSRTTLLNVAEEHIFRQVTELSATSQPSSKDPENLVPHAQLIQGALIMEMLQFGQDNMQTRRRIRIIRHPCLVSAIRSFGIFQLKRSTSPRVCDERTWQALVIEETFIRIACWVFLADGFLTVCFKNHPALSSFEMDCHLPWSTEMWEAEDSASFSTIAGAHVNQCSLPPLREVITQLLDTNTTSDLMPWSGSLSAEHLLMLIYALSSLAFQARAGLLGYVSPSKIKDAATNWKRIWDSFTYPLDKKQLLHLGYPKHAEELWWLLNATLEAASRHDSRFLYLENSATDDLGNLNEFIQWCSQST